MEFNYLARFRTIQWFYDSLMGVREGGSDTPNVKLAKHIILARGVTPWANGRPIFNPSILTLDDVTDSNTRKSGNFLAGGDASANLNELGLTVTPTFYLVLPTKLSSAYDSHYHGEVTYNNQTLQAYDLDQSVAIAANGKPVLYIGLLISNPTQVAVSFRQFGLKDPYFQRDGHSYDVYMYENNSVQTININQENSLELKLLIAFYEVLYG